MFLRANGTQKEVRPYDGERFTTAQLQALMGGEVATLHTPGGQVLIVRAQSDHLMWNRKASDVMGDFIVGDALLAEPRDV